MVCRVRMSGRVLGRKGDVERGAERETVRDD